MAELNAVLTVPSGFRDVPQSGIPVTIIAFVYGKHRDAGGYDRLGECTLAVYTREDGRIDAGPLSWFRLTPAGRSALEARQE